MEAQGAYGNRIAEYCYAGDAPYFVLRRLGHSEIAVTLLKCDQPSFEKSDSTPLEDAFIAAVSLCDGFHRDHWLDNRPLPEHPPQPAGIVTFIDLRRPVNIRLRSPISTVQFYFSRAALNELVSEESGKVIDSLAVKPLHSLPDAIFFRLALSLMPALNKPNETNRLFVDHIALAASAHVIKEYAKIASTARTVCGGLAPWQLIRAKELMDANMDGSISLAEVAAQCQLSTRHFTRAFGQSTGMPPHRWLLRRRVERAKDLLRDPRLTLMDVAIKSGFADQRHLIRVFSHSVGETPGVWRRMEAHCSVAEQIGAGRIKP
jgi:AraC-like DNA-binding protein